MKLTLAATLLALVGCGSAAHEIDTEALAANHDDAWNRHDPAAMLALFADEGTLVTPTGTRVEGREALAEMLRQPGPTRQTSSTVRFEAVQWLSDDLVLLDGVQTLEGPGTEIVGSSARIVAVVRRNGDRWELLAARPYVPAQPMQTAAAR